MLKLMAKVIILKILLLFEGFLDRRLLFSKRRDSDSSFHETEKEKLEKWLRENPEFQKRVEDGLNWIEDADKIHSRKN